MSNIAGEYWMEGRSARTRRSLIAQAITLLEEVEPSSDLSVAYGQVALGFVMGGDASEAIPWADKALALAERLNARREELGARLIKVCALLELGVAEAGVEELREIYAESLKGGWEDDAIFVSAWLCEWIWLSQSPSQALSTYEEAIERAERCGNRFFAMNGRAESLWYLYDLGEWDRLLDQGRLILDFNEQRKEHDLKVMGYIAHVLAHRHHLGEAHGLCEELLGRAREAEDYEVLVPALAAGALVAQKRSEPKVAVDLVRELHSVTRRNDRYRSRYLPTALRVLVAAGEVEEAESLAHGLEVVAIRDLNCVLSGRAIIEEARGRTEEARRLYEQAAERWADYGFVLEEGEAHLGLARCLIALGEMRTVSRPLQEARAIFSRLGATSLLEEADGHLQRAEAVS